MISNMDFLYQPYLVLTAGQRKLLCFLAYTGKKTDEQMQALYRHGEDLKADQMKKQINGLRSFYDTSFYSYRNEYQLHAYHVAPLMLYMLDVMPQWLEHFDKFYKKYQTTQAMALLSRLESCLKGEYVEYATRGITSRDAEIRVPLASDARFLPMMNDFLSPNTFISEVVAYQVANDIADPENVVGQIADLYYKRMMPARARELKTIVAFYDFLWWNPAIEQQATDRAYRIGQRQNVTVYHLISQHTIEEKILRLHQTKRNLADAMLEGTNESHKLTSKDLLAMIDKDS